MANEITIYSNMQNTVDGAKALCKAFASMMPGANDDQGMAIALAAFQEGLNPIDFARRYHWIPGKGPSMRADAMRGEFRKVHNGEYTVEESTPWLCKITFTTASGEKVTDQFTALDLMLSRNPWRSAKDPAREGWKVWCEQVRQLCDKNMDEQTIWRQMQPNFKDNWGTELDWQNMLLARRVSTSLRKICPELVAGIYTPEEMEDTIIGEYVSEPARKPVDTEELLRRQAASAAAAAATPAAQPATQPTTVAASAVATPSSPEELTQAVEEYIDASFSMKEEIQPAASETPPLMSQLKERLIAKIQQDLPVAFGDQGQAVLAKTLSDRKVGGLFQLDEHVLQEISDKLAARIGTQSKN